MITSVQNFDVNFGAALKLANSIKNPQLTSALNETRFANQLKSCSKADVFNVSKKQGSEKLLVIEATKGGKRVGQKVECAAGELIGSLRKLF